MPEADGVGMGREHYGDRRGQVPDRPDLRRGRREDEVDRQAHQLGGHLRQLVDRCREPELNDQVLAFDIAEVAQAGPQRLDSASVSRGGTQPQEPEPRDLARRLRARRQRPRHRGRRAAEQGENIPSPHANSFPGSDSTPNAGGELLGKSASFFPVSSSAL